MNLTRMKKKQTTHLFVFLFAILVSIATVNHQFVPQAQADRVTQEQIDALKDKSDDIASQRKKLQEQIAEAKKDKNAAMEQKKLIEQEINLVEDNILNLSTQIETYNQIISQREELLIQTQEAEAEQYELFCQRVRYMEEHGQDSYWAVLFQATSFSDLLDRFTMVEEIIEYDNSVMEHLTDIRDKINLTKTELEDARADLDGAKAREMAEKEELKIQRLEVEALIKTISAQESELQKAEDHLRSAASEMDGEITKKEQDLKAYQEWLKAQQGASSSDSGNSGGGITSAQGFLWPISPSVRNYNYLSSFFGSRRHPITNRAENHTGVDIPVAGGTPIFASKSGVITISGYHWSYGNYVVVSHTDGYSTLYAHMSKRAAKEGQVVEQGQVIGYVGTTGSSTGNHLHFEVRINGARKDPLLYFKGSTLYAYSGGKTVAVDWNTY